MAKGIFLKGMFGIKDDGSVALIDKTIWVDPLEGGDQIGLARNEEGGAVIRFREPVDPNCSAAL